MKNARKKVLTFLSASIIIRVMKTKPEFKEWLKTTGQTNKSFAEKHGFKTQWIQRITAGKENLKIDTAIRLWELTGYEVRFISLYPMWLKLESHIKKIKKEDVVITVTDESM
jgi:plasmid maintenance system antidote protein VapI